MLWHDHSAVCPGVAQKHPPPVCQRVQSSPAAVAAAVPSATQTETAAGQMRRDEALLAALCPCVPKRQNQGLLAMQALPAQA